MNRRVLWALAAAGALAWWYYRERQRREVLQRIMISGAVQSSLVGGVTF